VLELFHRVADPQSAKVRKYVSDHGLLEKVRFRNLVYPEVAADFAARSGVEAPALWDGKALTHGADAIIAKLAAANAAQ
jgi:hypothetical protein